MQPGLFDDQPEKINIPIKDGEIEFYPNFFDLETSNNYFKTLFDEIDWKQEKMNMYGKEIPFPRLTAWYGDQDKPYSFSGITLQPEPWTSELKEIVTKLQDVSNHTFNSVLLNRYRDGNDSISWHTDAEKELGLNPMIASVNFGASRKFQLRHMDDKTLKEEIILSHGSLLIMSGSLQHYWQHQLPKTKAKIGERINLTFRKIITI
jgi:alkylated DNA repair dioxygenase AlkB